ncbi:MAG TPA: VanZ family protein, partial [Clostridia bacterium]|nr:VanZ family protein [Clostridia bacterium]
VWLPPFFWISLIFLLSSFPKLQISEGLADLILRKLAHMFEYGVLYLLIYRVFKRTSSLSKNKLLFISLFLTILYAVSDEYHQTFVPGRCGNLTDISIDSTGAVLGLIFSQKILFLLPKGIQNIILARKRKEE